MGGGHPDMSYNSDDWILITGGTLSVSGPTQGADSAIDFSGTAVITGNTYIITHGHTTPVVKTV